jgi:(1->4)-alpha-D-glucan 1-alpha-D-glucosylmutase
MTVPISTYRLQIRPEFDLAAAAATVAYIRDLGADWVYLSPLLSATEGSDHGYDVVDHSQIDPTRGGAAGLDELSTAAHSSGLRVLIDIVPNHMGVPHENGWWWDLLTHGRDSRYAEAFDVDWAFGNNKVRIPVLGGTLEEALEAGDFTITNGELHYFENRFPLAPGTADSTDIAEVLAKQNYELMNWRRADAELNYR